MAIGDKLNQLMSDSAKEVAAISDMPSSDIRVQAQLQRLKDITDEKLPTIIDEHVQNIHSQSSADRAVDIYTSDYLLSLPISHDGISKLCGTLIGVTEKYGVDIPSTWKDFAIGNFDYEAELMGDQ